jgi:hypothetical protein
VGAIESDKIDQKGVRVVQVLQFTIARIAHDVLQVSLLGIGIAGNSRHQRKGKSNIAVLLTTLDSDK